MCSALLPKDHDFSRCDDCQERRAASDFEYHKRVASARFPESMRRVLAARLTAGEHLTEVCGSLEISTQLVHGFKAYDESWADTLDGALLAGRDPALAHGTFKAYRQGRCRCPQCREHKLQHDSWRWRRPTVANR